MKVLLDENLPHDLRHFLADHNSFTVAFMGWKGVQNGELLRRAAQEGFDAVLTKDAGIEYEQSLHTLPVSVILIQAKSNAIDDILPLLPALFEALASLKPRSLVTIS